MTDQVRASVASSLRNLTISASEEPYIDCLLLHSPLPTLSATLEAWNALAAFVPSRIRRLGISNCPLDTLRDLSTNATTAPVVVQNRFMPATAHEALLRRHMRAGAAMTFQAFSVLTANRGLTSAEPVRSVADAARVSSAAALYALVLGLGGTAVLDGTTDRIHMAQDLAGVDAVAVWAESREGCQAWDDALRSIRGMVGDLDL